MTIFGRLSESGGSTVLRRLRVTAFTGFLLTSESSSNYVCSCANVNTRWHHHTWHRCASSCRPTHVVVGYDQRLVMIFWSHVPGLPATVHVASPCPARRAEIFCRRNWGLLHWHRSSSVTDSKLYCFCGAMLASSAAFAVMRCLCLSVCLSVTFVRCVKTNKHIINNFSPSGSHAKREP